MISSTIKISKLDLNSKQSQDPTVKYCLLFIPKNANIVEDVFKFSDMKRALVEMELTVEDKPLLDNKDIVDFCDDKDQELDYVKAISLVKTEVEITNEPLTNSDNGEHYDNEISHIVGNAKVPEPTPIKNTPLSDENHIVNLCDDRDQELGVAKA